MVSPSRYLYIFIVSSKDWILSYNKRERFGKTSIILKNELKLVLFYFDSFADHSQTLHHSENKCRNIKLVASIEKYAQILSLDIFYWSLQFVSIFALGKLFSFLLIKGKAHSVICLLLAPNRIRMNRWMTIAFTKERVSDKG